MAGLANAIDFAMEMLAVAPKEKQTASKPHHASANHAGAKHCLYALYAVAALLMLYTHDIALIQWRPGWSCLSFSYFCGSCLEFLGLCSLCLKAKATQTVAGISSQSLTLVVCSLLPRVIATIAFEGYLPVDKSGDHMVQLMDFGSLIAACWLLHNMHKKYGQTYQKEHDTMGIKPILLSCAIAAFFIHGSLNRYYLWDAIWAFSLNVEIFMMLPQLYMLTNMGGLVDNTLSHYVVNSFLACVLRFVFWLWAIPGCTELSLPDAKHYNLTLGAWHIVAAYCLETLIVTDFVYYYVKARLKGVTYVNLPNPIDQV